MLQKFCARGTSPKKLSVSIKNAGIQIVLRSSDANPIDQVVFFMLVSAFPALGPAISRFYDRAII